MTVVLPRLFTVKQAERRSSLSAWELRRLCETGELERRYVGAGSRYYRITSESLERYLDNLPTEPVEAP